MSITLGDQRFAEDEVGIIAAPRGVSTHAKGTWEVPCEYCGVTCLLGLKTYLRYERTGVPVFCGPCALQHHPAIIVGSVDGRTITLREAIERGLLRF